MTTNPTVDVRVLHFRDVEIDMPRFDDKDGPAIVDADVFVLNGERYEFHVLSVDGSKGGPPQPSQQLAITCALSCMADDLLAKEAA